MKEDLLKIINHYGVMPQLKYFQSEVFELNEAIINRELHWNYDTEIQDIKPLDEHITEEIADVMVMIEQFRHYYNISSEEVTNIFWSKVNRQLDRINNENK
jgi:NTP pyrophosphatase (non-canonical NTP hydrolase)